MNLPPQECVRCTPRKNGLKTTPENKLGVQPESNNQKHFGARALGKSNNDHTIRYDAGLGPGHMLGTERRIVRLKPQAYTMLGYKPDGRCQNRIPKNNHTKTRNLIPIENPTRTIRTHRKPKANDRHSGTLGRRR